MYLPIKLKNGKIFHVEVAAQPVAPAQLVAPALDPDIFTGGPAAGVSATASDMAEEHFGEAVGIVEGIALEVSERLVREDSTHRLSEVELELELGFDATGKVLIFAEASASASLKLKLTWALHKK